MHLLKPILIFAVLLFFVIGTHFLYHMFMADYYIAQAKQIEEGKEWNTAVGAYESAIDHAPGSPEYRFLFGKYYLESAGTVKDQAIKAALLQKAWNQLEEARDESPKDARIYLALGQTLETLSSLIATSPHVVESNYSVAGTSKLAEEYYRTAVSLYPSSTQHRYPLASYYRNVGRLDESLKQVQTMIALDPAALKYVQRNRFWDIPNIDETIENGLHQALTKPYTRKAAFSGLISQLVKNKKWLEAASLYKKHAMAEGMADQTSYYLTLGRYLLYGGEGKEAQDNFLKMLAQSSDRLRAVRSFIGIYLGARKPEELFALLENMKSLYPELIEIELDWAQVLYRQKQYQDARTHLERLLEERNTPVANYWMALTCKNLKKPYEAEIYIKQAIKWKPEDPAYRYFYAGLLYDAWRLSEALEQADAAIQTSDKNNFSYLDRKAWILYRMKRYEESIKTWKSAALLRPGHQGFQRNIQMAAKAASLASADVK